MVLVRDDGTINDVGFGDWNKTRSDWWLAEVRRRSDVG
jgi:hypothetical protein